MSDTYMANRWTVLLLALPPALLAAGIAACGDPSLPMSAETPTPDPAFSVDVTRPMMISAGVLAVGEVVPPPDPCVRKFNLEIKGTATHLGRFEGVGSTCVLEAIAPDPDPPFLPAGPAPYFTAIFSNPLWVLTTANGDELWLEAPHGVCVFSLVDNSMLCEEPEASVHFIIGGTGRFANATGELISGAVNEDGMGPDDFESHGWIRY